MKRTQGGRQAGGRRRGNGCGNEGEVPLSLGGPSPVLAEGFSLHSPPWLGAFVQVPACATLPVALVGEGVHRQV